MNYQMLASTLVFANPQWMWIAGGLGITALVFLFLSYRNSHLRGFWKGLAIMLKLAAFALLGIALLEPVWVDKFPRNSSNDLVILADNSRGLSIEDQGKELQKALGSEKDEDPAWLEELGDLFRLQRYQFDRRLKRVDDFSGLDFSGDASAMLTSVKSLRGRYKKRPLAAMVVLSDGNATDTEAIESVIEALRETEESKRAPVYPVLVGKKLGEVSDLAIADIEVSQSSFEDAPVTIRVQASARGKFENGVEIFALNEKGEEVKVEPVIFAGENDRRTGAARLKIAGVRPGISFYSVGIRAVTKEGEKTVDEVTLENNQRLVSVDRGAGPYRVLYVSGRPNWEYKFLRRALSEDAEIDLVALIRIAKREPKFEWRGRVGESGNPLFRGFGKDLPEETQSYDQPVLIRLNTKDPEELRDGFPRDAETLYPSFRAIILDDVEADFISARATESDRKLCIQTRRNRDHAGRSGIVSNRRVGKHADRAVVARLRGPNRSRWPGSVRDFQSEPRRLARAVDATARYPRSGNGTACLHAAIFFREPGCGDQTRSQSPGDDHRRRTPPTSRRGRAEIWRRQVRSSHDWRFLEMGNERRIAPARHGQDVAAIGSLGGSRCSRTNYPGSETGLRGNPALDSN